MHYGYFLEAKHRREELSQQRLRKQLLIILGALSIIFLILFPSTVSKEEEIDAEGVEPPFPAPKAGVLPLDGTRQFSFDLSVTDLYPVF